MRLALLCALAVFTAQAQYVSPKLKKEHREIRNLRILPAGITLQYDDMKGGHGLPEESEKLGQSVYAAVAQELAARGASVLPKLAVSTDDERFALTDWQRKFDTIAVQLYRKPHGLEKGRYTLGDGVAAWPPAADADTLVFIRGSGNLLSNNKQAFYWLTLRPGLSMFLARVAFADSRSGEIIALARFGYARNVTQKSEHALRSSIREAFHDLPLPKPFKTPSRTAAPTAPGTR